jgi:hypothetical protein
MDDDLLEQMEAAILNTYRKKGPWTPEIPTFRRQQQDKHYDMWYRIIKKHEIKLIKKIFEIGED